MRKNITSTAFTIIALFVVVSITSCSTGKKLTSDKQNADKMFNEGNYGEALKYYEEIIKDYESKGKQQECPAYSKAGIAAYKSGNAEKAVQYLNSAVNSNFNTPETLLTLADIYHKEDNLSKELLTLEELVKKFPEAKNSTEVKKRLFKLYVESENFDKALKLWPEISTTSENNTELLTEYFIVLTGAGKNKEASVLAKKILKLDPDNVTVLEWQAKRYYTRAEKLYGKEMKAYQKNRTNAQYNKLIDALDIVSKDFNKSLKIFEKLYKMSPKKEYAKYLYYINDRLDNKQKAKYYKLKAGIK